MRISIYDDEGIIHHLDYSTRSTHTAPHHQIDLARHSSLARTPGTTGSPTATHPVACIEAQPMTLSMVPTTPSSGFPVLQDHVDTILI